MRIGFVIGNLTSQQPTFSGIHLAWAAHCRGHEVRFVSSEDLSFLDDGSVFASTLRVRTGDYARPVDFQRALLSNDAVREDDTLSGIDVVFNRCNPLRDPASTPPSPILDFCPGIGACGCQVDVIDVIGHPELRCVHVKMALEIPTRSLTRSPKPGCARLPPSRRGGRAR